MQQLTGLVPLVSTTLVGVAVWLALDGLTAAWDGLSARYLGSLRPMLAALRFDEAVVKTWLQVWCVSLFGSTVLIGAVAGMPPIAVAVAIVGWLAPRWVLEAMVQRRQILLREQMSVAAVSLAAACRAGLALAPGLATVQRETPEPLASEFHLILSEYEHGRPLAAAIADARDRLRLDSFTLFASAILVSLQRGGRITDSLQRISHSLQENQRIERRLDAETASGRRVVWILAICPILFLVGFSFIHPAGTALVFNSLIGQFALMSVILLVLASVGWSRRILRLEV